MPSLINKVRNHTYINFFEHKKIDKLTHCQNNNFDAMWRTDLSHQLIFPVCGIKRKKSECVNSNQWLDLRYHHKNPNIWRANSLIQFHSPHTYQLQILHVNDNRRGRGDWCWLLKTVKYEGGKQSARQPAARSNCFIALVREVWNGNGWK